MWKNYISSPALMMTLIIVYCVSMAIATFIERDFGAQMSRALIYHNIWFIFLQALISVNAVYIIKKMGLFSFKKLGSLLFHLSFVVILLGALTTHLFSKEGVMHIREGESSNFIYMADNSMMELPMDVFLEDFVIERYSGSDSPSSYESHVTVRYEGAESNHLIRMNKVMNIAGYRFFQSSYDKDEKGSILTVNYDVPGMYITYFGYLLLVLGFIIFPFQYNSRFQTLNRQLKHIGVLALLFFIGANSNFASAQSSQELLSVPRDQAEKFGRLLIQNPKGRVEPVNTWSSEILRKIHQEDTYNEYTADQIFLNLFAFPDVWAEQPLIEIKNEDIRTLLGTSQEYVRYNDFFSEERGYIIQKEVEAGYGMAPSERSKFYKDLLSVDEVVNIIFQIQQGLLMPIFPSSNDEDEKWLSPGDDISHITGADSLLISKVMVWYAQELSRGAHNGDWNQSSKIVKMIETYQGSMRPNIDMSRIEAELNYNRLKIFNRSIKFYLILGVFLLGLCVYQLFGNNKINKTLNILKYMLVAGIFIVFLFQTYGFALRWYFSGRGPWSNSYETMIFVSWTVVAIGLSFLRKDVLVTGLCSMLGGVLLFVASLNWMNPEITPLVPVLQSYWLMLHVAVIMMGYGFFFISALLGLSNLVMIGASSKSDRKEVLLTTVRKTTIISEMAMILGTVFMCVGIFLGAVWANESWGRYWGWDPKETWALITMMVYVGVTHMRFVPKLNNNLWLFNLASLWSILSVLMTYFGVNMYLSGLHSYGNRSGDLFSLPILLGVIAFFVLSLWSYFGYKSKK